MFPPFKIPNPFISFLPFLWEKFLAVGIAKASNTLCEHLGNMTAKCWVQQPSSWLNPLRCDCWVISVLGDQYQVEICRSIIMEAFAHPFCRFIEFREGWKRFRTNTVTGDFLVCVIPSCDSVPSPEVVVAPSAQYVSPQLFFSSFHMQLWDRSSHAGIIFHQT